MAEGEGGAPDWYLVSVTRLDSGDTPETAMLTKVLIHDFDLSDFLTYLAEVYGCPDMEGVFDNLTARERVSIAGDVLFGEPRGVC